MNEDPAAKRQLGGSFELTAVLTDKRQLRISGYVYSDDVFGGGGIHDLNLRVDMYQNVLERQLVRCDLTMKEAAIAQNDQQMLDLLTHFEGLAEKKKSGKKMTSQELEQLNKFDANVRFLKKNKESLAAAIAEGRKKLNGAAAP